MALFNLVMRQPWAFVYHAPKNLYTMKPIAPLSAKAVNAVTKEERAALEGARSRHPFVR